jgi:limonene-1,2-epoxide hydrolase
MKILNSFLLTLFVFAHSFSSAATNSSSNPLTPTSEEHNVSTNVDVVRTYIRACNEADQALLASVFSEDVRIYFVGLPAVVGREKAAAFWSDFNRSRHTVWTIDHVMAGGNEVAIEWSALRGLVNGNKPKLDRGSEWYVLADGKIKEIRQYYDVRGELPEDKEYELTEFPYSERGYSTKENFMETLP